ncbi:MAG: hypothetical protein U9N63_04965 [Pseudomonadota bacterium]|nr:hypothetical protein [Pseudomonadota bacterium]
MQIRNNVNVSVSEYNRQNLCEKAELKQCPIHPEGGCGIRRHGSYERVVPMKFEIPRWYCRKGHATIALVPDFLPSRFPGTLKDVEEVVVEAQKHPTLVSAAEHIRPDIGLQGGLRWLNRRINYVSTALKACAGLFPEIGFKNLEQLQKAFGVDSVLSHLREILKEHLYALPRIIGLIPPPHTPVGG